MIAEIKEIPFFGEIKLPELSISSLHELVKKIPMDISALPLGDRAKTYLSNPKVQTVAAFTIGTIALAFALPPTISLALSILALPLLLLKAVIAILLIALAFTAFSKGVHSFSQI